MIKIIAWFLLILFSPFILFIGSCVGFIIIMHAIIVEMERIINYQITPYIQWKIKDVRERFRKKDNQ